MWEEEQDSGSTVPEVSSSTDTMAGPRSHSSMSLCFVSSRTLLIRVFHGVNCDNVLPRDGRGESGQTIDALVDCLAISEWTRSAGSSVICDPRDGAPSKMQAISINIADRPPIIMMPYSSIVPRLNTIAPI